MTLKSDDSTPLRPTSGRPTPMPAARRAPVARVVVTATCFVMATLAWGTVFYGHSVYMDTFMRTHGWSAALISSAILVFWIASLPGALSVGVLVDRFGSPLVVALGGLCIGLGLMGLAVVSAPWHLFALYALMGFGYPALAAAAISATLVPWFERGFGTALGVALTGASVGGALIPVMIVRQSDTHGFAPTMMTAGSVVLVIVLLAVIVLARIGRPHTVPPVSPSTSAATPYSMAGVLRQRLFWQLAIAAAIGLGGQVGLLAHQIPIIAGSTDRFTASLSVTVVAVASAVGRLLVGMLCRVLPAHVVAALSYLVLGGGVALLAIAEGQLAIMGGCALAGLVVGAVVLLPPVLVREAFGTAGFGRSYALVNVVMYVLAGVTPWLVGMIYTKTGSYVPGLWMLVGMELVAAILVLSALRRTS